ncbi:MAG: GWxTD domain-containing protein [Bacteroidia bacterium]|nr:GWxTD domain-containing protein [Bacteroidia bacterium]
MKKRILFLLVVLMYSCGTGSKAPSTSKISTYKKEVNSIHPQFAVFHVNDSLSELHYKIASKELLYTRPDAINFSSNVLISYRLVKSYDSKDILDSSSVRLVDENNANADKYLVGKINIKALYTKSYYLKITVTDLNRNTSASSVIVVEKDNELNRQNFIIKSKEDDIPLFRNYLKMGEEVSIQYKQKKESSVFVRYYNRDFPLAAPPFSLTEPKPFQYKSDSTFVLKMSKEGHFDFTLNKKGFYHFQLDTTKRDGLTVYNFTDAFPEVKNADGMLLPLRYITSRDEFTAIANSVNRKAAVEKFWLDCTGNMDRAKEVIRKFYTRVNDANSHFSSYIEGWKTDRGLIYLIYGSPGTIYRTANTETWIYGEVNSINSLQYTFVRVNNPFTENDFSLERSAIYRQSWYMAVDVWRQGRAYLQD